MARRVILTILLLEFYTCLHMANCFSPCFIHGTTANCYNRRLYQVPPLPNHITYLNLANNYISELNKTSFLGLEALEVLNLQQQETQLVLKNNAFARLSNLLELKLGFNHFLQLETNAFSGLHNLQILNLIQCNLKDSILSGDYMKPLVSLESLTLETNDIKRVQPARFFLNMTKLHQLDLSHNWINSICEEDFIGFQGKHFTIFKLTNIKLTDMSQYWSKWDQCGNPFKDMSINILDLSHNSFSVDMARLFFRAIRGTQIDTLILSHSSSMGKSVGNNNLKDPDQQTFKDLAASGIKEFDLSKCRIFALTHSLFHNLSDLQTVSLASNSINQIESNAFLGVPYLRLLNLSSNLLDKIDSRTFSNLPRLEVLDLSYNNIRILTQESFSGLPNLLSLDLTDNSLQDLYKMAQLPQLKELYLSENKIKSLYGLSNIARNVSVLHLANNKLTNAEDISYILEEFPDITGLSIEGNVFIWCFLNRKYSVPPSNKLQLLNLRMTGLQNIWAQGLCLDVFDNLHQLQYLFLQNNYMQTLPKGIFKGLTSLHFLNLSTNSLTYIPNGTFPASLRTLDLAYNHLGSIDPQALSNITEISLYKNSFLCDCGLRRFQKWLNETSTEFITPVEDLICGFPEEQRGVPLVYSVFCEDLEDKKRDETLRITLFICCTTFILLIIICAVVFIRLRGYCFKPGRQTYRQTDTCVSLSMARRVILSILLLEFYTCLHMANCFSPCLIYGTTANCYDRRLYQVPPLPNHITYLNLANNYISELTEASFLGLEALEVLNLQQQETQLVLKNNTFARLSNLLELNLGFNHFLQLETNAFSGLHNLQILNLIQCNLKDSILSGDYMKPLVSLESLTLETNDIKRVQPARSFLNMTKLHQLDLSHNWINSICEEDFTGFQGKHFTIFKLTNIKLTDMSQYWSKWDQCGNPFKDMSINILDLSHNSFSVDMALLFFRAIRGTRIDTLILSHSSSMGKSVGNNNMKDPDQQTFKDLAASGIKEFDLSKCRIFALTHSLFHNLPDLQAVSLASNSINQIESNAFLGVPYLRLLNLSSNLLDKIESRTFSNLPNLEFLDLSYNNLRILTQESFSGLPNLLSLDLTDNSLQDLYKMAQLPQLKELYLANNKIKSLYGLSNIARNVSVLHLANNKLTNAEDIYYILEEFPDITGLSVEGNVFIWCYLNRKYSVSPLNKLQLLNLRMTGLQNIWAQGLCLDVFDNLHQLQYLFLQNNYMQTLPKGIFKGLTSLHFLNLSTNSLTYIPNGTFPASLRTLDLAYNHLGSIDPQALSNITEISLYKNSFLCDCGLRRFQKWLNETSTEFITPVEDLICEFPEELRGVPLVYSVFCEDLEDEESDEILRLTLFICCTTFILLIIICAVVFIRLRGYCFKLYRRMVIKFVEGRPPGKEPGDDGFLYDVYLCFSSNDFKWVEKALLKKLDSEFSEHNQFRCCFEARDFLPGEDHLSNMRNAVWNSKKVLCVVSREFLKNGWCLEAFTLAQSKMLEEVQDILLMLLVDQIPQYRLMKYEPIRTYVQTKRYLCWPEDSQDLQWFYNQLQHSILKGTKAKQAKIDAETANNVPEVEAVTVF
ncbi:toll-like receptor 5 [Astyanax mexicanus]|uniref:toll-like receptor 5 n=1 Tax=Astyanax mexicanus TaxID=7994 RepID=UPI0020CB464A|nr:toll-like receptor 5 [Astyanax mexicanus]